MKITNTKPFALLLSLFFLPSIIFCQVDGLIGYYAFTGSAIDSSEYEHHGAVVNAVLTENLLGETDKAYVFNGENSYITAGTANTLKVDTALTISAWFRATGTGSPNAGGILVNKEGEYSFARFADGSIRYALAFNNFWDNHINTNVTVPLNEDTHAVLTYSQAEGKIKVYINCELVYSDDENAVIGDFTPDMNEMRIGGRMFLDQFFDGTIDEVKVFDRALTAEEVTKNCVLTSVQDFTEASLNFEVYPNPSPGYFHMRGDFSKVEKIKIFNQNGQLVKILDSDFQHINLSGMSAGLYLVAVFGENNQLLDTKKIIKSVDKV